MVGPAKTRTEPESNAMIDGIQTVLMALITLGILVAFHEYGHFWVARRCGIKVLRFSIGFGAPLWRKVGRDGTEYTISAIPLGGYVRMLDEREGNVAPEERSLAFNRQSVWARIAVVSAGPLANFILAIGVFWFLFFRGETGLVPVVAEVEPQSPAYFAGVEPGQEIVSVDGKLTPTVSAVSFRLLERLGDTGNIRLAVRYHKSDIIYESKAPIAQWLAGEDAPNPLAGLGLRIDVPPLLPVIDEVVADGPADRAGFLPGDLILQADGQPMPLWADWVGYVREHPERAIDVVFNREGIEQRLRLVPERRATDEGDIGSVGMMVAVPPIPEDRQRVFERGLFESLWAAAGRTAQLLDFTFSSMIKMVQGLISPTNLSGPITIAQVAASSAESGFTSWLSFLALLSVSLGALNLLPIPVLDGGHLLFYAVEAVTGKPVPEKVQAFGYQIGLMMVLSLMAFAIYNDVARL